MKLERISLQLRDDSVRAFDFHPGLTVIEAAAGEERALVRALVGSLSAPIDGVHVEFSLDDGAFLVAFRPYGAAHRVIDAESSGDVSDRYRTARSGIDVLAPWSQPGRAISSELVAGGDDLVHGDPTEHWVSRLAGIEPGRLLASAEAEVAAEQDLRRATAAARATPEDAAAVEQVEAARNAASAAERRHNRLRVATLAAGTTLPVGAVVGLNTLGVGGALGLIGGTLALTTGCLVYERRLARAIDAESSAVAAVGESYDDVRHRIDDTPLGDTDVRGALLAAAERYQRAATGWQEIAGNVPAPWVLAQEARIRRVSELQASVAPLGPEEPAPLTPAPRSAALIAGLTSRAAGNRDLTADRESLPLFLDDPLSGLEWAEKAPVLEFLGRLANRQQLVLVTADPEVLSWARLEAMAGTLGAIVSGLVDASGDSKADDTEMPGGTEENAPSSSVTATDTVTAGSWSAAASTAGGDSDGEGGTR